MEITNKDASIIAEAREKLSQERLSSFLSTLENDEDPSAERHALISLVSRGLERLSEVESIFVKEMLEQKQEELCLGCLCGNVTDYSNINSVITSFNHYLGESDDQT